jgi:hypothetical protein
MTIVCEDYPEIPISKENFATTQKAVGRPVDGLPEEGYTPGWSTPTWSRGQRSW